MIQQSQQAGEDSGKVQGAPEPGEAGRAHSHLPITPAILRRGESFAPAMFSTVAAATRKTKDAEKPDHPLKVKDGPQTRVNKKKASGNVRVICKFTHQY